MIKVFYDGKCGLCRREINHYKRIAPLGVFQWTDLSVDNQSFLNLGLTVEAGLQFLHLQDEEGKIHRGLDSFLIIWRHIPRLRWLSAALQWKPLYCLARSAYNHFARWRFRRMGYGQCNVV